MPKLYGTADVVEEIAKRLLPTYHSELATARIKYIYVDKASKKNGRLVWGKARRITGSLEFLLECDFLVEVALECWDPADDRQRQALVDHLLESCFGEEDEETGEMKWSMRSPDVNEFTSILNRHGAWNAELVGLVEVAQRLNIEARVQEVADSTVQQNGM